MKEKKKLLPNSVLIRTGQENSEKESQKIKKPLSGIIFGRNGDRYAEKEKKHFNPEFRLYSARGRKFRKKNSKKIQKINKNLFPALFLDKTG